MAITRIGNPAIADQRGINFRNIIINGGMDLAQRGTSQASAGDASGTYDTVDRFAFANQNMGAFTISQDTDVPSSQGFAKSLKLDCTTADASPATSDYLIFLQRFEGQNLQYLLKGTSSAQSLTLSFWVKSNKTGTYIAELRDNDNTRSISKSYTIDSASTWEKKTITYDGDTTGAFDNDNAASLNVQFWLGAGTNFTSGTLATSWESITNANRAVGQVNLADSTSNEWYVTGIQLEAGSVASDFEFLPVDCNLQRCSRYYTVLKIGATGYATGSGQSASVRESFNFMSPMRSAPSFTTSGLGGVGINTTSIANDITENGGYVSPFSTATGRIYFAGTFVFNSEL
jgi:hypothetical protein